MPPFLLVERAESIVTVRMNRPEQLNALTDMDQMREFANVCADIGRDRAVRVVILTGVGAAFCAGGNIKNMRDKQGISRGSPYEIRNNFRDSIQRIPLALHELEVPVVAAVNGPAIGAGLDIACMCDIRVASDTACFAESFVRLGIVPGDGGAWLLPRVIGMPRATFLSLTGESIDARTALEWGLVHEVTTQESVEAKAREMAARIAAHPPHALRLTKRLLREAQHMQLASLLELSAAYQALAHHTEDHQEAVAALIGKRPASFTGR